MSNPPDSSEYAALMSEWFDELAPRADAFKKQFPHHMVGFLKYLFAINMMQSAVCADLEIPEEKFQDFITSITAMWFAAGKPDSFSIARGRIITEDDFKGRPN